MQHGHHLLLPGPPAGYGHQGQAQPEYLRHAQPGHGAVQAIQLLSHDGQADPADGRGEDGDDGLQGCSGHLATLLAQLQAGEVAHPSLQPPLHLIQVLLPEL